MDLKKRRDCPPRRTGRRTHDRVGRDRLARAHPEPEVQMEARRTERPRRAARSAASMSVCRLDYRLESRGAIAARGLSAAPPSGGAGGAGQPGTGAGAEGAGRHRSHGAHAGRLGALTGPI